MFTEEQKQKLRQAGYSENRIQATERNRFGGTSKNVQETKLPLLTKEGGNFGSSLKTSLKDITVGAGKSFIRGARDVAGMLQGAGQRIISGFSGKPLEEVEATTGFKSISDKTAEGQGVSEILKPKSQAEKIGGYIETGAEIASGFASSEGKTLVSKGKEAYERILSRRTQKKTAEELSSIKEAITPTPTVKQAKIAQEQGRFYSGKQPTLLRSGTPDKIATSKEIADATRTIQQKIPNASKMKPSDLYTAVDEEITSTAQKLRPEMQKIPIKPETVQKINSNWDNIKKLQLEDAPATEEINVLKRQKKFESFLKKSQSNNQADLWDTRIAYDKSIPEAVKKADKLSSESLQLQKEEWLQNRRILTDAINDTTNIMSEKSKVAFSDMSNLYEARNNLMSKAKVSEAKLSKIRQFAKDHPETKQAIAYTLGALGIKELLD